jgi:hypothetical protein
MRIPDLPILRRLGKTAVGGELFAAGHVLANLRNGGALLTLLRQELKLGPEEGVFLD